MRPIQENVGIAAVIAGSQIMKMSITQYQPQTP
jgi:hypothetical protein